MKLLKINYKIYYRNFAKIKIKIENIIEYEADDVVVNYNCDGGRFFRLNGRVNDQNEN